MVVKGKIIKTTVVEYQIPNGLTDLTWNEKQSNWKCRFRGKDYKENMASGEPDGRLYR